LLKWRKEKNMANEVMKALKERTKLEKKLRKEEEREFKKLAKMQAGEKLVKPEYLIVMTTVGTQADAKAMARKLVEKRLAACVQIEETTSVCMWKGKMEEAKEFKVSIKTKAELFSHVENAINTMTKYDLPQIVAYKIKYVSKEFAAWMEERFTAVDEHGGCTHSCSTCGGCGG